jgi:hypothetical protein
MRLQTTVGATTAWTAGREERRTGAFEPAASRDEASKVWLG